MGDDTWTSLYPNTFNRTFAFPSLIVKDIHTVDNGVVEHLVPTIQGPDDWDVIIAHFLGVDHVGHTFGSLHPVMATKLDQMNDVLTSVLETIDKDTLFVMIGDHGMTEDGNHGV